MSIAYLDFAEVEKFSPPDKQKPWDHRFDFYNFVWIHCLHCGFPMRGFERSTVWPQTLTVECGICGAENEFNNSIQPIEYHSAECQGGCLPKCRAYRKAGTL